MKDNGFYTKKKQKPDDTSKKLLQTQTTQMISGFLKIRLPKLNPYFSVWSKQQDTLAYMWMQTKRSASSH